MKNFEHKNVMNLIGISLNQVDLKSFIVMPFMPKGDLLSYVRDKANNPTVKDLITFGIEIAKGM